MPQCQFPVLCCFCVSEKLHRKYSRNRMKQSPKFLFPPVRDEVQRGDGGGPGGRHTIGCPPPTSGRATRWCGPLVHPLKSPFHLYNPSDVKTLKKINVFPDKVSQRCRHRRPISGDRSLCFGTLPGQRIAPGAISIDSTAIFIVVAVSYDEE
jgi:hypothetical protein